VGAEHDRARALGTGDAGEQVAGVGAGVGRGPVLLDVEVEPAQLGGEGIRHGALAAGGALDLAEADEVREQALAFLGGGGLDGGGGHCCERYPQARRAGAPARRDRFARRGPQRRCEAL
jgi:hypothetical protein